MNKISLIFVLFVFDVTSKILVSTYIEYNYTIQLNSFFNLTHIHNFGISFGLFSQMNQPWLFIFLGILITIFIYYMMTQTENFTEKWALLIIIAGAISNIFDRCINGYVIDFISLHYKDFYWPAFNFADIYISLGIIMMILSFFKGLKSKKQRQL